LKVLKKLNKREESLLWTALYPRMSQLIRLILDIKNQQRLKKNKRDHQELKVKEVKREDLMMMMVKTNQPMEVEVDQENITKKRVLKIQVDKAAEMDITPKKEVDITIEEEKEEEEEAKEVASEAVTEVEKEVASE
jgi:hypothetical protein